jgi:hypothetical protein
MRILRVVGSGLLPCGCFVGLYETYDGPTVQIIEERGVACLRRGHEPGQPVASAQMDDALVASGHARTPGRSMESR